MIEATLLSGKTKSCGCWRSTKGSADIDLTGQTFGYWTVVEPAEKSRESSITIAAVYVVRKGR